MTCLLNFAKKKELKVKILRINIFVPPIIFIDIKSIKRDE